MCGGAAESAGMRLTLGNLQDGRNLKYCILLQDTFAFGDFLEWLELALLFQVIHLFGNLILIFGRNLKYSILLFFCFWGNNLQDGRILKYYILLQDICFWGNIWEVGKL